LTFALRVVLLTALRERRRHRARGADATPYGARTDEQATRPSSPADVHALSQERRETFLQLLDGLSEQDAELLALHCMLGDTVDDIATSTGRCPRAVWLRLSLGKRALRQKLQFRGDRLELCTECPLSWSTSSVPAMS
jgi:DNA-directed RNA polymerase specialized sigma24 family protein